MPYFGLVLRELLNSEEGKLMSSLQNVVTSYNTVKNIINALQEDGLDEVTQSIKGRKTLLASLTTKIKVVARKIKEAKEIAPGKSIPKPKLCIDIPEGLYDDILRILKIDRENSDERDFVLDAVKRKVEIRGFNMKN